MSIIRHRRFSKHRADSAIGFARYVTPISRSPSKNTLGTFPSSTLKGDGALPPLKLLECPPVVFVRKKTLSVAGGTDFRLDRPTRADED